MEIPLFPLRTVLFPGMVLPLQIFEPRYRTMLHDLAASGGVFGVLLIREGEEVGGGAIPYEVGTTAIAENVREAGDGRYLLDARGLRRFRLLRMLAPRPYPYGEVAYIDDDDEAAAADPEVTGLVEEVHETFPRYFHLALSLSGQWARPPAMPSDAHALADALGPWLQIQDQEQQLLLATEDARTRLALLRDLIGSLLERKQAEVAKERRRKYGAFGATN